MAIKFASRREQRHVTETMTDLLLGIKKYANEDMTNCIDKTIEVLLNTDYEGEIQNGKTNSDS